MAISYFAVGLGASSHLLMDENRAFLFALFFAEWEEQTCSV